MNERFDDYSKFSNTYENARYYVNLANENKNIPWAELPKNFEYSAPTVSGFKYKGQDINMGKCGVNQVYFSIPPGTTFLKSIAGSTSSSRELYPTTRLPDGQFLYKNMTREEPVLNGKRFMYDVPFENLNPVPGIKQVGYRRKIYPLTDQYPREISKYSNETLPSPNY